MKHNLLKIGALLALTMLGSQASASIGQSFMSTLMNTLWHKEEVVPTIYGATVPTTTPAITTAPSVASVSASLPQATQQAHEIIATPKITNHINIKTIQVNPKQAPQVAAVPNGQQAPVNKSLGIASLFDKAKKGFNSFTEWLDGYTPSQETLIKGALVGIAGSNAIHNFYKMKSAYNTNNTLETIKSGLLSIASATTALLAVDVCREKISTPLSAALIAATALDLVRRMQFSEIVLCKSGVINNDTKDIKCCKCLDKILTVEQITDINKNKKLSQAGSEVLITAAGTKLLDDINPEDNIRTGIVCLRCANF